MQNVKKEWLQWHWKVCYPSTSNSRIHKMLNERHSGKLGGRHTMWQTVASKCPSASVLSRFVSRDP